MPSMWLSDTQKIGVAFSSGGGLFLLGGVMMFFDRAMLAMGNVSPASSSLPPSLLTYPPLTRSAALQILFLIGLTLIIGPQKTLLFFARRQKWKGTAAFVAGIALILLRWAFVGFVVETYGILVLFGDFFATIAGFIGNVPVVGPYVARALEKVSGGPRNAELPV
ncbi:hypothetical protein BDV95DRAFT_585604 [Massariosphaeria phaeospora]|uniref:Got1/Sft2-like family-domain-containing protein n=1 Tax=Massariosphaeria phaeospora TaxID=100035 RepID=A0A7C8M2U0_9PLEO|nr:hypothetical protein BDV95DRAFT_585604 [Massariosphaeria phaeospora]